MKRSFALATCLLLFSLSTFGAEAQGHGRYLRIKKLLFDVFAQDGSIASARLVLDRQKGQISCFTVRPATLGVYERYRILHAPEGTYYCTDGDNALIQLALQKRLSRAWSIGDAPSASCESATSAPSATSSPSGISEPQGASTGVPKFTHAVRTKPIAESQKCDLYYDSGNVAPPADDDLKCIDEGTWDDGDAVYSNGVFWNTFWNTGGGCMAQCTASLTNALAICSRLIPGTPAWDACVALAGALYVACIAGC